MSAACNAHSGSSWQRIRHLRPTQAAVNAVSDDGIFFGGPNDEDARAGMGLANPDLAYGPDRHAVLNCYLVQRLDTLQGPDLCCLLTRNPTAGPVSVADVRSMAAAVQHIFRWCLPADVVWIHAEAIPA